jgi:hypothetical protein
MREIGASRFGVVGFGAADEHGGISDTPGRRTEWPADTLWRYNEKLEIII